MVREAIRSVYGTETWSGRQEVLVNHTTETIATLDSGPKISLEQAVLDRLGSEEHFSNFTCASESPLPSVVRSSPA